MINKWLAIPKVGMRPRFSQLFLNNDPDDVTKYTEDNIERYVQVLTTTQRTAVYSQGIPPNCYNGKQDTKHAIQ